jgi:SWI/SNF-related matrix-associated actin-dependent regulator 1 of chromatin subfamily A
MNASAHYGLKFSAPKIVMTKYGEREVRSAQPTEEFWSAWRAGKDALKAAGFGVGKAYDGSGWEVSLWAKTMSSEARQEASEASRATDAVVDVPVPAGQALMPFQRAGIAYALKREGALIGDEMGLGKTIQAIGFANATAPKRILVVAPASLLGNWRNEIKAWQTLDLPIFVIRPNTAFTGKADGWYVINYDIVGRYDAILKSTDWDLMILDECQYLKTRSAKRTLTLLGGSAKDEYGKRVKIEGVAAKRRLALTGTPIMNRPAELFPILHNLDPKRWPTFSSFAKRYCDGQANGFGYDSSGASRLDELNARLRETVMVRRLKAEVLTELPAKRRQIVTLDVEDEETRALVEREVETYERTEKAIAAAAADMARAEVEGDEIAYNTAVGRLKEAQGIAFTEMAKIRHEVAVAKIPAVIEHLKTTTSKVLVFAWHTDVIRALAEALDGDEEKSSGPHRSGGGLFDGKRMDYQLEGECHQAQCDAPGIRTSRQKSSGAFKRVVVITGETKVADRQSIVERFQTDPAIHFFVANIKAAGVGLTLTASSHVVFAELDWTPSSISQAEDRAHRIGQAESVLVQHLVLDGSLDGKMAKMIVRKQAIIDRALDAKVAVTEDLEAPISVEKPVEAAEAKSFDAKKAALTEAAARITADQIAAIHQALRTVAAMDEDRASALNDIGFNKMDTAFGCDLAAKPSLSPRQAAAAMKMIRKYRRQYSVELYEKIFEAAV